MHHDTSHGTEHEKCGLLNIPHGTDDISHIYHDIPHGTEHPPPTVLNIYPRGIEHFQGTENPHVYSTHTIRDDYSNE